MQLIKVYANKESFREVHFNEKGLNFIVALQEIPGVTEKGQTYNGVGKSLLVRIIHFCLGASADNYLGFCERLADWEFFLDFKVANKIYTAKRRTNTSTRIFLNGEDLSVKNFNQKLETLCFKIPKGANFLSFRSLMPFFLRPNKEAYVSYYKPGKTFTAYQTLLYNAFLLGIDSYLLEEKRALKREKDKVSKYEKDIEANSLLRDYFTGNKDVKLALLDLDEKIKNLDDNLKNFKVAKDYNDMQIEADRVERKLFLLNNKLITLQNQIKNIDLALEIKPDINKEHITNVYNETRVYFPLNLIKQLNELEVFYEELVVNRRKKLLESRNKLKLEIQDKALKVEKLQDEFDKLMQYLGEHQALDVFVGLSNKSATLKAERDNLKNYQGLQENLKEKKINIDKSLLELLETSEEYLKKIEDEISNLRSYFRFLAKRFYPNSVAGLTIETNGGDNQLQFDIEARIESDSSDGISNVKIFCYDLTILFKGSNHNMNFIFHDSRLFDGVDERQKADLFQTAYDIFSDSDKQYIASVNQNQLEEIKRLFTKEEYEKIIEDNTILTLKDGDDSQKLLGIRVDIGL